MNANFLTSLFVWFGLVECRVTVNLFFYLFRDLCSDFARRISFQVIKLKLRSAIFFFWGKR